MGGEGRCCVCAGGLILGLRYLHYFSTELPTCLHAYLSCRSPDFYGTMQGLQGRCYNPPSSPRVSVLLALHASTYGAGGQREGGSTTGSGGRSRRSNTHQ